MKRWAWLLFALGMPLSSPLACAGDGCLRSSDCRSDQVCRAGKCELRELPLGEGGAGEDPTTGGTTSGGGSGKGGVSGSSGSATAGKSAAGDASDDGGATAAGGG